MYMAVKYRHLIRPILINVMWRGEKLLEESESYLIELITIYCIRSTFVCQLMLLLSNVVLNVYGT